ncbi:hypothetical protein K7X08_000577 [Anisodus acutangulus]|uniref:Aminoacylase-1 n=1 Tax=Anisodus acutangulus TaxID=402998 RepID=A0A9Q1M3S4_9SOLA|nr:hypothetical protein K7X08_000577 [Anisodus acutangulus]
MLDHLQPLPILLLLLLFLSLTLSTSESDTPISRFQQYLRINTAHPNPNYTTPINYLTNFANSIPNLHSKIIHLTPTIPLLLLTWPGSNPSLPSILFNSHLDSVPAEPEKWTHPPFAAHKTSDGRIFARGAQDDKCIGMQYLEAIKAIQSSDPNFVPLRNVHILYVPEEEVGGFNGMRKFVERKEFEELNVGFVMDEGQASTNDEFRVFYADRTPWHMVIKAVGMPGHGSKLVDNTAMENLMKSIEVITKFRESKFVIVKAGLAANSEVISVNPVFLKAGTPSPTGFVMNMQPSEAEAGFDIRMPPTADPQLMRKIIEEQWAPAWRNMTYEITEKGFLRDNMGRPLMTLASDTNPWWSVFNEAVTRAGGKLSKPEILASTTDARFMRRLGIPTFGFSPMKNTPILLHDHNEFLKDTVYLEGIKHLKTCFAGISILEKMILHTI